jgi:hypothetical protein
VTKTEIIDFDPTLLSKEECNWLLENIDKPTAVALSTIRVVRMPPEGRNRNSVIYPDGVNPNQMKPLLDRFQELDDFEKHQGIKWVGREAIKRCIETWLKVDAKWESDWRRTRGRAPRFPSFYSYDTRGKGHFGGPGSDNGKVKTYFNDKGERVIISMPLIAEEEVQWSPGFTEKPAAADLTVNAELKRIECFCGHTEQFKEGSRSSYNAARARISKHLRAAKDDVERHRELYTVEFKG